MFTILFLYLKWKGALSLLQRLLFSHWLLLFLLFLELLHRLLIRDNLLVGIEIEIFHFPYDSDEEPTSILVMRQYSQAFS